MNYRSLFFQRLAFLMLAFLPECLMAAGVDNFGGQEIAAKSTEIKTFLLGPVTRFAAVMGLGWGVIQAVMSSAVKPLLFWGAIAVTVSVGSGVIDNIFPENTMIIPTEMEICSQWNDEISS
ncbi:MAG: hypothetical protein ACE5RS_06025 [Nitrosopumilus sp.]